MRCPSRVVQAIALIAGVAVAPSGWAATADEAQATIEPYALGGVSVRSIGVSPSFAEDHALFAGEAFRRVVYRLEGPIVSNSSELISTSSITEIALTPDYRQHGGGGGASGATGVVFAGGFTGGPRSPWVHRSEDGGATWVPSFHSDGIPGTRDISVSPDFVRDRTVFLATNAGLAKSTDGGATFIPHNGGLPFTNTSVVAVSPAYGTDRTVFTGLQGTGEGGVQIRRRWRHVVSVGRGAAAFNVLPRDGRHRPCVVPGVRDGPDPLCQRR